MPARKTRTEIHPRVPDFHAVFAHFNILWMDVFDLVKMCAPLLAFVVNFLHPRILHDLRNFIASHVLTSSLRSATTQNPIVSWRKRRSQGALPQTAAKDNLPLHLQGIIQRLASFHHEAE